MQKYNEKMQGWKHTLNEKENQKYVS